MSNTTQKSIKEKIGTPVLSLAALEIISDLYKRSFNGKVKAKLN